MFTLSDPSVRTYWIAITEGAVTGVGATDPGQLLQSPADELRTYTDRETFAAEAVALGFEGELP